jgi:hypothetical protein
MGEFLRESANLVFDNDFWTISLIDLLAMILTQLHIGSVWPRQNFAKEPSGIV